MAHTFSRFPGFHVPDAPVGTGQPYVFSGRFAGSFQPHVAPGRRATIQGLPPTGMAPIRRMTHTDFGSAWRGAATSEKIHAVMKTRSEGTSVVSGLARGIVTGSRRCGSA